jgi:hypothetical protein
MANSIGMEGAYRGVSAGSNELPESRCGRDAFEPSHKMFDGVQAIEQKRENHMYVGRFQLASGP